MVNNLKPNFDNDDTHNKRTKRLHNDPQVKKEYSVGEEDVNKTNPKTTSTTTTMTTTKLSTKKLLTQLEILDTKVEPKWVRYYLLYRCMPKIYI